MSLPVRLLGFAFTNADFLFETDTAGKILFAAGAANDLVNESGEALIGKPAAKLFKPSEGAKFATFAQALKSGDRAGPFKLTLATGADANLAMFRLPENGANISCTLTRPGTRTPSAAIDPKTGLASREGFMAAAAKASERDTLTLVHVQGLPELCAQLPKEGADALLQRIGDSIQSSGASAQRAHFRIQFRRLGAGDQRFAGHREKSRRGFFRRRADAAQGGGNQHRPARRWTEP